MNWRIPIILDPTNIVELLIRNHNDVFKENTCIMHVSTSSVDVLFFKNDLSTLLVQMLSM